MKTFLMGLAFSFCACVAQAQNDCTTAKVRWAEDPLIFEGEEIIPFFRPDMIKVNEAGECFINNTEGYEPGSPQIDGEGFAKIDFVAKDGKRTSFEYSEAETVALAFCNNIHN